MLPYKAYLIDLDGTMYRGNQVIEEAPAFIQWLKKNHIPFLFLTNNSSLTPDQVATKLNRMGVECESSDVYTTSMATAEWIASSNRGKKVYAIGEEGLMTALQEVNCQFVEEHADVVVIGIDRKITYEKMAKASLAIQQGATFLSTNSDRAIPTEKGLVPGNGALTAAVTAASGASPQFIGKPEPIFVELALKKLGCKTEEVLLVGDNLHTDIAAGVRAKVDTLLVYTGITRPEELQNSEIQPTYQSAHLQDWVDFNLSGMNGDPASRL